MRSGTKTKADLISEALAILNVAQSGQPLPQETYNRVEQKLTSIVEELNARDVAAVPDLEAVQIAMFLPLAEIVAARVAPDFGVVGEEYAGLLAMASDAERRLRHIVAPKKSWQPLDVEWF